jgi:hypothetical protein
MALSANSVFEVQTGGNDTNGGGFVTGAAGTDYSLVAAKRSGTGTDDSTTDAVANGTTTITSATANFQASIVGNIIYLQGGTGALAATRRQVTARTNATTITVDATVAAGTGITMNVGGALASIGGAGSITLVSGNIIYIKAGTYTIASASTNIATGCFSKTLTLKIEGYQTSRGDLGTPPLLQASGISTFVIIALSTSAGSVVRNISFDGASLTSSRGMSLRGIMDKCTFVNCTNTAATITTGCATNSIASGCTGNAFSGPAFYGCVAHTNSGRGFISGSAQGVFDRCISYGNTGANGIGFEINGEGYIISNCVTYNNAAAGFRNVADGNIFINCIAEDNTAEGFLNTAANLSLLHGCAAFSNSTDFSLGTDNFTTNDEDITGSSSFFVNAASANFGLNSNSPGGEDLKAVGHPGAFANGTTTGYLDIGAAQHQDSGTGGGEHSSVF